MASGLMDGSRRLGGFVGPAAPAAPTALAAHRTGTATGPVTLDDGCALGLTVSAAHSVVAAVVAIGALPRRRAGTPGPRPTAPAAPAGKRMEGTPA
ncbi:hypothetical protein [Streptomyces sp. PTD5-9]|uniref:hypothetical protein n=1 Tax=Streptomyces sp. PTD5-9 TaxID=3120150 RepID=UPI003008EEE9